MHHAQKGCPDLEAPAAAGQPGRVLESPAQPAPRDQARQAQQIEAPVGPDILGPDLQAGADGNLIEALIGQAIDLAFDAGEKAAGEAKRTMELARASQDMDAGAEKRRRHIVAGASLDGSAFPMDRDLLGCSAPLAIHRHVPSPGLDRSDSRRSGASPPGNFRRGRQRL